MEPHCTGSSSPRPHHTETPLALTPPPPPDMGLHCTETPSIKPYFTLPRHGTSLYMEPLTQHPPPPQHPDMFIQTCSTRTPLHGVQAQLIHHEAQTVGKRTDHVLLECFLVPFIFTWIYSLWHRRCLFKKHENTDISFDHIHAAGSIYIDSRIFSRLTKCSKWLLVRG